MSYKHVTVGGLSVDEANALLDHTPGEKLEAARAKLCAAIERATLTSLDGFSEGDRVVCHSEDAETHEPIARAGELVNVFPSRDCLVHLDAGYSASVGLDKLEHEAVYQARLAEAVDVALGERRGIIVVKVGRHEVHFTRHALDRWWERCQAEGPVGRLEARRRLLTALAPVKRIDTTAPPWSGQNLFHRARTEGYVYVTPDICFPVIREADGHRVATTCLTNREKEGRAA